jgi:tetratricopeptide (TPR) repeat protein
MINVGNREPFKGAIFRGAVAWLFIAWLSLSGVRMQAAEDWQSFSEQLESRRLFRLADIYLADQIQLAEQGSVTLRNLYVRRVHLLNQWAIDAVPEQRASRWAAVEAVMQQAREDLTDAQSTLLFDLQQALTDLSHAQSLREEDEWAAARDPRVSQQALQLLKQARQRLEETERSIPGLMTDRNARYVDPWKAAQWIALQRNTRYQLARVAFERAYWYEASDRLNRVEALQAANAALDEVASQVASDEVLWWEVQLSRIKALRQLEQWEAARQLLIGMELDLAPLQVRPHLVAEWMRIENLLGATERSDRIATAILKGDYGETPEPLIAVLELMLDRFEATKNSEYQKQAVSIAREIESRHGNYWGRRANRLLVSRSGEAETPVENLDVLIRIADETYLKGEWKEALIGYERALEIARKAQDQKSLVTLWGRIAAIYQQAGDHPKAATCFFEAAALQQDSERAGELAFWGVSNLQAASRGQADFPPEGYRARLTEFIEQYPSHDRINQVRLAAVAFEWQQGNGDAAVTRALSIPLDADEFFVAASLIGILIDQYSRQQPADSNWDQRLIDQIAPWVWENNGQIQMPTGAGGIAAAVLWSRLQLQKEVPDRSKVADLLAVYLAKELQSQAEMAWRDQARLLVIASLAGLPGRHDEVPPILKSMTQQEPAVLLEVLGELQSIMKSLNTEDRQQVAQWQLQLINQCQGQGTTIAPEVQNAMQVAKAWAFAYSGQGAEAVEALKVLIDQRPQEGALQEIKAEVLNQLGEPFRDQAIAQWRLLASRSQPRTDRWFKAKYWVIQLTLEQGDRKRATQLLQYLKTVPPGWSEAANREQFDQLAKKLL